MLEPAHIAGISKTGYAPATPRSLDWQAWPAANRHEERRIALGDAESVSSGYWSSSW
jgi:hypothetical protein